MWRQAARDNAQAVLVDLDISTGEYLSRAKVHSIQTFAICPYGGRGRAVIASLTMRLGGLLPNATVRRIAGAGHRFTYLDHFGDLVGGRAKSVSELAAGHPESLALNADEDGGATPLHAR
jgi:hypothetical protein